MAGNQSPGRSLVGMWRVAGAVCIAGMATSAYAWWLHGQAGPTWCDLDSHIHCSAILRGPYSRVGPVPIAALGLAGFAVLFTWTIRGRSLPRVAWPLAVGAACVTTYLTGLELLVFRALCPVCMTAWTLTLILAAVLRQVAPGRTRLATRLWQIAAMGLLFASLFAPTATFRETLPPAGFPEPLQALPASGDPLPDLLRRARTVSSHQLWLYFYHNRCGFCYELNTYILPHPLAQLHLWQYQTAAALSTEWSTLMERVGATTVPTVVILDTLGQVVERLEGLEAIRSSIPNLPNDYY